MKKTTQSKDSFLCYSAATCTLQSVFSSSWFVFVVRLRGPSSWFVFVVRLHDPSSRSVFTAVIVSSSQAMESKLLCGGKNIIDHTNEQQRALERRKQDITEEKVRRSSEGRQKVARRSCQLAATTARSRCVCLIVSAPPPTPTVVVSPAGIISR